MGYTTEFVDHFQLDKPLTPEHKAYLHRFADIRHVQRDPEKLQQLLDAGELSDSVREAVGLPVGPEGCFYVGENNDKDWMAHCGQVSDSSKVDDNHPPGNPGYFGEGSPKEYAQPSLWCQWKPTEDGEGIEWDGNEKFYCYVEWLRYLIDSFIAPWGYKLNGEVSWSGEEAGDIGIIYVKDNEVQGVESQIINPEPTWTNPGPSWSPSVRSNI